MYWPMSSGHETMSLTPVQKVPQFLVNHVERVGNAAPATLGTILPFAFPAYARVLNPVTPSVGRSYRWGDLARSGATVDASTQWSDIVASGREVESLGEPESGTVEASVAARLAKILAPHTATPQDCFFLVWEGYSGLREGVRRTPTITVTPSRRMHVLHGTLQDATESIEESFQRLPTWWLPADGAWCLGNDVYGRSVYVGGSSEAIAAVLRDPALEAYAADPALPLASED